MEFIRHHRSYQSIVQKAFDLELTCKARWSEEEEQLLIDYYRTHTKISKVELSMLIPAHPAVQCITKASYLGLSRPKFNWTLEKDQQLEALYPTQGTKCASTIGCTSSACVQRAHKLGIKFIKPEAKPKTERVKFAWTLEEDTIIKTIYSTDIEKCVVLLTNRSRASIVARAKALGIKVDRTRKVKCIETNIIYSVKAAAEFIGKAPGSILYAIKSSSTSGGYHWEYVD
jgi:hypothetical protein